MHRGRVSIIAAGCVLLVACATPTYRYTNADRTAGVRTLMKVESAASRGDAEDHEPRLVRAGELAYPTWAALQSVCGTIVVATTLDARGQVVEAHVVRRDFNADGVVDESGGAGRRYTIAEIFDAPALRFVRTSGFEPAVQDGKQVEAQALVPVSFANQPDGQCRKQ